MKRHDTIMIEGWAYSCRVILELRQAQIEVWKSAQPQQPPLLPLKDDARPKCERTPAGRYIEPTLLALLHKLKQ